jgi:hypothetical protein
MARKGKKWARGLLGLSLAGAMTFSMGATAFAEVETEPDWNEAGLKLLDIMYEHKDDPLMTEFLLGFQRGNMDDLTGEMPVAEEVEEVEEVFGDFAAADDLAFLPEPLMERAAFSGASLIAPMSSDPVCDCCRRFRYTFTGTTATITGRGTNMPNSVNIPATIRRGTSTLTVRVIGFLAFHNQQLGTVVISEGIQRIENDAFHGSTITSVDIPSTVTNIGAGAFFNCESLSQVIFRRVNVPSMGMMAFGFNNITILRVPYESVRAYQDGNMFSILAAGTNRFTGVRPFCRFDHTLRNCTCRFRPGDVNGNREIDSGDSDQINLFLTNSPNSMIRRNDPGCNHLRAALVTPISRANGTPRVVDAQQILRFLVGLCSHVDGTQCSSTTCCNR